MIRLISFFFSIAIFISLLVNSMAYSETLEQYYEYLSSNDHSKEDSSIYYFYDNRELMNDKIKAAVVELYKKEHKCQNDAEGRFDRGEPIPKEYWFYFEEGYYDRIYRLCSLAVATGNRSIIPIVVDRCQMEELLVGYGDLAIEPVIKKLVKSQNTTEKVNQLRILQELVRPKEAGYVAKGEKREMAKGAIMRALKSDDISVSLAAARAIAATEDEDVLPILEEIARKSSDYLAKEAAQKGIAKIRGKSGEHKPTTPPGLTNKPTPPGQEKKQ